MKLSGSLHISTQRSRQTVAALLVLLAGGVTARAQTAPNLVLDLDTTSPGSIVTYTTADANGVYHIQKWHDRSGGGHDLTSTDTAHAPVVQNDPVLNCPAIVFDDVNPTFLPKLATSDSDLVNPNSSYTVIALTTRGYNAFSDWVPDYNFWKLGNASYDTMVKINHHTEETYSPFILSENSTLVTSNPSVIVPTTLGLETITYNSATSKLNVYIQGVSAYTATLTAAPVKAGFSIGPFCDSSIIALQVYDGEMTTAQRQAAELALAEKYKTYYKTSTSEVSWIASGSYSSTALGYINQFKWTKPQADTYMYAMDATASPAHVPGGVSGLSSWLKADRGVALDSQNRVVAWTDQITYLNGVATGSGNPLTVVGQHAAAQRPAFVANAVNGNPGVSFDGNDDILSGTAYLSPGSALGNTPRSLFVLTKYDAHANGGGYSYGAINDPFTGPSNGDFSLGISLSGTMAVGSLDTNSAQSFGSSLLGVGYVLEEVVVTSPNGPSGNNSVDAYLNTDHFDTVSVAPYATGSWYGIVTLGGRLKGDTRLKETLCETLVYNKAVSADERAQIEQYFISKYNLQPKVAPVVFNPGGSLAPSFPAIHLSTITVGASIFYTLDGSTPQHSGTTPISNGNGTTYLYSSSSPIVLTTATTIKARAYLPARTDSDVTSQNYQLDTQGPVVSNLQFNQTPLSDGGTVKDSGTFSVTATDTPAGVTRLDFYLQSTTQTPAVNLLMGSSVSSYSAPFNVKAVPDGNYHLIIKAYDAVGNLTTQTNNVTVSERPPLAPVLTSPTVPSPYYTGSSPVTVKGTAAPGSTIQFFNNGLTNGAPVLTGPLTNPSGTTGTFQGPVSLTPGTTANRITAKALNADGRGELSDASAELSILIDPNLPGVPPGFHATSLTGGSVQLSWGALAPGATLGYNIYRSTIPNDPTLGTKLNGNKLITDLQYIDKTQPGDGTFYYIITAVSPHGNEGVVSQAQVGVSDKTAPKAISIVATTTDPAKMDSSHNIAGDSVVNLDVTMSEPLQSVPFLSVTPHGGYPISVNLTQDATSSVHYTGQFSVPSTTPAGTANLGLIARDLVGNRGTDIDNGNTLNFDTVGPAVIAIQTASTTVKNVYPTQLDVTFVLDRQVKATTTPQVKYTLSSNPGSKVAFDSVTPVDDVTIDGQPHPAWKATMTLPSAAGGTAPENLDLFFTGTDDLAVASPDVIGVPHEIQIYQGDLPPSAIKPQNFVATAQPGGPILLQWDSVDGAAKYQIFRLAPEDSGSTPQPYQQTTGTETTYEDTPASDGLYVYTVAAIRQVNGDTSAPGTQSTSAQALSQHAAPHAPQNFAAVIQGYGLELTWDAPEASDPPKVVTYSVYRSSAPFTTSTDLTGLPPLATNLTDTNRKYVDAHPDPTKEYYGIYALDGAKNISVPLGNATAIDVQLRPVSNLQISLAEAGAPVISWSAVSGSNIVGYNVYLGPDDQLTKLNAGDTPQTATTLTDSAYTHDERRYTIRTVDNTGQYKDHSLTLPLLTAVLDENAVIRRGLINDLYYTVTNSSAEEVTNVDVKVTVYNAQSADEQDATSAVIPLLEPGESQRIKVVVGGFADLPQGSASIKTSIEVRPHDSELVSIQHSGQVSVVEGALAISVLPHDFTRNGHGQVRFALTNPSTEEIQVLVSTHDGSAPSPEARITLTDGVGNVYSLTPLQLASDSNVYPSSGGGRVLKIPAGSTVTTGDQQISVPNEVPDNVYVQLDIDHVYFDRGGTDQVTLGALTTRQSMTVVDSSYIAQVSSITPSHSTGNVPIVISGTTKFRNSDGSTPNVPALNQPVVLHISNSGFELAYQLASDSSGAFSYSFTPPPGTLGGVYSVWAVNPQVTDRTVQCTFTIDRLSVTPNVVNLHAPKNYPQTIKYTIQAGPGNSAAHIHFDHGTLPTGVSVDSGPTVDSLAAGASTTVPITITGNNDAPGVADHASFVLHLLSDGHGSDDPWQTVQVNCGFSDALPALAWSNTVTATGVHPNETAITNLTLSNPGLAAANNVTFQVLNADHTLAPAWVSLSVASVSQINVGDTIPVALSFNPPATTSGHDYRGDYMFIVRATAQNEASQDAQVYLSVTDAGSGQIRFHISDIYTNTLDTNGDPIEGVHGAKVTLQSDTNSTISYSMPTDANGEVLFQNVNVGHYQYHVTADGHDSASGGVWVQPLNPDLNADPNSGQHGAIPTQEVLLQNTLVNVTWEVVPTTIQDIYNVTLNVTFQTNVPAPVVTVEPAAINLPAMKAGDVYNGQVTFTNHGLIAAQNGKFGMPADDGRLHFELQGTMPETLDPGQSVTLPYRITCVQEFPIPPSMAMVETAGEGSLVASLGIITLAFLGMRRLKRLGLVLFIGGAGLILLARPARLWAQTTSNCFSYGVTTYYSYGFYCKNGLYFPVNVPMQWFYIINHCPTQTVNPGQVSTVDQWQFVPGHSPDYGPSKELPGSGPECFPIAPDNCSQNQVTKSSVNLTQREYRDNATDLAIKIPGGTAEVLRRFYYKKWSWVDLTESLKLNAGPGGVVSIDFQTENYLVIDSAFTTYIQATTQAKILAIQDLSHVVTGYHWQAKDGEWKDFDATGKLQKTGNRNLTLTQLHYNGTGALDEVDDANGNRIFTVTMTGGLITDIVDSAGREVQYNYDGSGRLHTVTNPENVGNTNPHQDETYNYDSGDRITSKKDVNGHTYTITYNGGGYVSSETDEKGNGWFFTFSYDRALQQYYSQVKTSAGKVEEKTFASDGTLILDLLNGVQREKVVRGGSTWNITEPNGASVQQTFDEFNNLIKEVRPDGTTTYQYDLTYNQPTQITYPDGSITKITYDAHGNLTDKVEASNFPLEARTTHYVYDSLNQLTDKTDARGNRTHYEYDAKGNLLHEYDPNKTTVRIDYTYDAAGNRLTQTDALGHTTCFKYDKLGRVTTEIDALHHKTITTYDGMEVKQVEVGKTELAPGRVTQFEYDVQGRKTKTIRLDNATPPRKIAVLTTTYDGDGNVVSETNALGQSTIYQYDQNGWRTSVTKPYGTSGSTHTTYYNSDGTILKEVDPADPDDPTQPGAITQYEYDSSGRISTRTEAYGLTTGTTPLQRKTTYQYDSMNHVIHTTYSDAAGSYTTDYDYDHLRRRTHISGKREYEKILEYDGNNNLVGETNGRGYKTIYHYDNYNRRTSVEAPGQTTSYAYDLVGNLIKVTDGNGVDQGSAYDELNQKTKQSIPMKSLPDDWASDSSKVIQTSSYDAFGEVTGTTDILGGTTSAHYDDFGRPDSKTNEAGLTLAYTYTDLGQVDTITFPTVEGQSQGSVIQYIHNSVNGELLDSVIDRAGNTTNYHYNIRFLKTRETASNGAITQYHYDPLGRLDKQTQQTENGDKITLWQYDQFDQVLHITYPDNTPLNPRVATYTYDDWGKIKTESGTGQYPVTYFYDAAGNRTGLQNGADTSALTQWGYDALNHVTSKTYADGKGSSYHYDPAGNLDVRTDARGIVTNYHYSDYGLACIDYPTKPGAIKFHYDAMGHRTQMEDVSGTTKWHWNAKRENDTYSQSAINTEITYDYTSEKQRRTMGVGVIDAEATWTTDYRYDQAGRLLTLQDSRVSTSNPFTYAYQPNTNWIAGHSNADGSGTVNEYDSLGRLTRISASGGQLNTSYRYEYDDAGLRSLEDATVGRRKFEYDNARQLSHAYRTNGTDQILPTYNFNYFYDSFGNWTKVTSLASETNFTPNNLNQYTTISNVPRQVDYDANGNMTHDGKGNIYYYDEENRLIEIDTPANTTVAKTINVYDGMSRRVEKRTYNAAGATISTTRYLYDGLTPIAEYDSTNTLQASYTRGLDLSGTAQGAGGVGGLLAMVNATGNAYSYFCDGNGNIVDLVDAYGNIAAHYEYDPFGNLFFQTGTLPQPYQWSSKEFDANTGLVYYLYRFYNPSLGKWNNRDPLGDVGGKNLYANCRNNLISHFDAFGYEEGPWETQGCLSVKLHILKLSLDLGLGFTIDTSVSAKACNCCNKVTHEYKSIPFGSLSATGSFGGGLELGFGFDIAIPGAELELKGKLASMEFHLEAAYEKDCAGHAKLVPARISRSLFIGLSLEAGEELGVGASLGLSIELSAELSVDEEGLKGSYEATAEIGYEVTGKAFGLEASYEDTLIPIYNTSSGDHVFIPFHF